MARLGFGTIKNVKFIVTAALTLFVATGCANSFQAALGGDSTASVSPTPTPSPSETPSPMPSPSVTPTPTPTPSVTPTPSPSPSTTPSPKPSPSPTPTPTPSPSVTPKPTPTPTPTPSVTPSPTPSATAPALRQQQNSFTGVGFGSHPSYLSATFSKPTLKGSAIWVVVSSPDHDYATPFVYSVTDSQGNTYHQAGVNQNGIEPGNQSVAQFVALDVKGDTGTALDTITFTMASNGQAGGDNYLGVFVAEVTGATAYADSGGMNNSPDYTTANMGLNLVYSGAMTVPKSSLVLALSMNYDGGGSDEGGSGYPGPTPATDLDTQTAKIWPMDGTTPIGTFASGVLSPSGGVVEAFFNASPNSTNASNPNQYATVAIAFY